MDSESVACSEAIEKCFSYSQLHQERFALRRTALGPRSAQAVSACQLIVWRGLVKIDLRNVFLTLFGSEIGGVGGSEIHHPIYEERLAFCPRQPQATGQQRPKVPVKAVLRRGLVKNGLL